MSLNFSDYQLKFYYGFVNSGVTPYGLVDPNGTFYSAQRADLNESPIGYRYGIYLDDTDHRRDPCIGYGFQWDAGICQPHVVKILLFTRIIST